MLKFTDRFRVRLHGNSCVYCGLAASTEDHFPPKSDSLRGFILPACHECNNIASTKHGRDFSKRVEFVKKKIKSKNSKMLAIPPWSQNDLEELGPELRKDVEICLKRRRIVQYRLAWNVDLYLASIDHDSVFVRLIVE